MSYVLFRLHLLKYWLLKEELLLKRTYYIFNNGELKRKDNTIEFYLEDGGRRTIPIEQVRDIYCFGQININSALISF